MTKHKASEGHIRGLEIDYAKASAEDRPGFLRHIVYAKFGQSSTWKGRFGILDEIANGAYELAPDKAALQAILETVGKDIQAYIEAAAQRNRDMKPGVVAAKLADASRRIPLGKEGVKTRLGDDMPKDTKPEQTPLEPPVKAGGGLFGNKPAPEPASDTDNLDNWIPRDQPPAAPEAVAEEAPVCLNQWALDPGKRRVFEERVEYIASTAGVDMAHSRAWALGVLGVSDETQIPMMVNEALKVLKAAVPEQPEPAAPPEPERKKETMNNQPLSARDEIRQRYTTKMQGREYLMVAGRIVLFRLDHPIETGWRIATELVMADADQVVFKAEIINSDGMPVSSGYARALSAQSKNFGGRLFEKAETAAIGRALAHAGYGTEDIDETEGDQHLADSPIKR